ncbi:unnamed protein product [Kuraishia capsulata CBS 1993]|uniref:Intimal thickness related receptor IRP domain-containing protein n=1 Tax=Kuraishia capsulata CBS 1993 TaxID=1382522 RepID=W6ML92_9ASCO|nr:uncharacterized protein KUCA_T00003214001 [Kuraishia capsulata CBS 1993]CDK27236.1 unnamed protein product [Kuraishia capsulata CBS 1993]
MTGYTRVVACLWLLCTLASALKREISTRNNRTCVSCHFVSSSVSPLLFLSQKQKPFLEARSGDYWFYSNDENDDEPVAWEMDIIFISRPDLEIVDMTDWGSYYSCWDDMPARTQENQTEIQKFALDEVLAKGMNQSAIMSFKLTPENNITGHYPIPSSGYYCAVATSKASVRDFSMFAEVNYHGSLGELDSDDHRYMYIYAFSSFVYFFGSIWYFYYVFLRRKYTTNDYLAIGSTKSQLKNAEIQLRILMYMLGCSLVYFMSTSHLYHLNKNGPETSSKGSLLDFASTALTTLFFCWALYNLLLMSSGYLFTSGSKDKRVVWFIRLVTISTLVGGLLSGYGSAFRRGGRWRRRWHSRSIFLKLLHTCTFLEYVVSFVFGSYLSIKTFSELRLHGRRATANRFIATVLIIILPIVLDGFGRDVIYIEPISSLMYDILEFRSASHISHLAATVAVAFLWRDTSLESEMVLKQE